MENKQFKPHKSWEEVNNWLKEKDIDGIVDISNALIAEPGREDWVYDITAVGDWKHTHLYLKWCMEQIGYVRLHEREIYRPEYDGSDFGESVHRYIWKTAADALKLEYEPVEI